MKGRASRHGVKAEAGKQGMARQDKVVVAKTGRQMKLTGTGPVVKQAGR